MIFTAFIWIVDALILASILRRIYKLIYNRGRSAGRGEGMAIGARWAENVAHKAFSAGRLSVQLQGDAEVDRTREILRISGRGLAEEFVDQQRRKATEQ